MEYGLDSRMVRDLAPQDLLGPLSECERKHAPDVLYVAGDAELLRTGRRVSVIGSRQASANGIKRARKLAKALVARNINVVSGLASGIDTAAHSAAMEHGGRTVAVLGTPVDVVYPKTNKALLREIIASHVAVSQFPSGTPTRRHHFPMRNRTMALLSDATVIVAAGERSGTVHQGREALRLGRDLLVTASLAAKGLAWVAALCSRGAEVLTDQGLAAWLDALPERVRVDESDVRS